MDKFFNTFALKDDEQNSDLIMLQNKFKICQTVCLLMATLNHSELRKVMFTLVAWQKLTVVYDPWLMKYYHWGV